MKKNTKLPTILGVLVLIAGLVAGVFLINSKQVFKLGATASIVPKNVRISNITDSSLTVTWTTDIETNGFIKWGSNQNLLNKITISDNSKKSTIHSENILGLTQNSDVFFSINSNAETYTNNGIPWQAKTLMVKVSSQQSRKGSGTILDSDASTPAKAIVYISINGILLSTLTSDEGNWIIPISDFIDNISDNIVLEIIVNGGLDRISQATIYPIYVESTPTIILGKTYDFRTLNVSVDNEMPKSLLSIPDSVVVSSRFEIVKSNSATTNNSVLLESVGEGETINTTNPEFFGKAPSNSIIEIAVESELQTDTLTVDKNGLWNWSPPNNLDPGEHKITLKWKDDSGILRTLTRSFIVEASEGPAFESSPSATPKLSTPTSKPQVTSIATSSATPKALPETGSLTPTIGLFIMGIGVLLSSIYIWNKSALE